MNLEEMRARLAELLAKRDERSAALEALRDAEVGEGKTYETAEARSDAAKAIHDELRTVDEEAIPLAKEIEDLEAREKAIADMRGKVTGTTPIHVQRPVNTDVDPIRASDGELRDAAMKLLERSLADQDRQGAIERAMKVASKDYDPSFVAGGVVITEDPAYQRAFAKAVTGQEHRWTDEERSAMLRYDEFRAVKGSVNTSGGFGVPIVIDPTIRITSGTGLNGLLQHVTIEPVTTDAWRGVTAAQTTWAYVTEGGESSDDAPTFAQPEIPINTARATIPYTLEAGMDYPGLATQLGRVLDRGYMDLAASKIVVGAGSTEPSGIFTELAAVTNSRVATTTIALFGAVDIDKIWAALPELFRERAVWSMNVDVENEIRAFGSGTATSRFTVDQTAFGISLLNGRPVVTSDHAPVFTATTGAYSVLCVFDPSEYIWAQRVGMTVEYVPHLFSTTNGLPTGQRALFAYARNGGGLPVSNAGRILRNASS